jgi:hypothetical protein
MTSTLSCFFIRYGRHLGRFRLGKENFTDQLVVGERGFGARIERKNVLLLEVGVAKVGVARDDRSEHFLGVRLPEDLQRGRGVDGRVNK